VRFLGRFLLIMVICILLAMATNGLPDFGAGSATAEADGVR